MKNSRSRSVILGLVFVSAITAIILTIDGKMILAERERFETSQKAAAKQAEEPAAKQPITAIIPPLPIIDRVVLEVPYVSEAPNNVWSGPWINACEEASIMMVDQYYAGAKTVSAAEATKFMNELFAVQNKKYGSNANSNTVRTLDLITNHTNFSGKIIEKPSIENIKDELRAGRPVISFNNGFILNNPHIPFLPTGSAFHVIVIKGFDDTKGVFITNDSGDDVSGAGYEYTYSTIMKSMSDYNHATHQVDQPPRVIFTSKK